MPHPIFLMKNPIQHYAWGSTTAIPELLGEPNSEDKPMAELWMGAHPKSPSLLADPPKNPPLNDAISQDSEGMLGQEISRAFEGRLPFLMKILAAAKPLSIQAHPSKEQAEEGFARENAAGILLNAPNRNYMDDNHKPELICALTPFWAMCGFRPIPEIQRLFDQLDVQALEDLLPAFKAEQTPEGLRTFFTRLLTLEPQRRPAIVAEAVEKSGKLFDSNPAYHWVEKLNATYANDIGVLSPLLLNIVRLMPGEALFLHAGILHAYLEGAGVEIMANSDNVLRGGLTPKHIDVDELLKVLTFDTQTVKILKPTSINPVEKVYSTPSAEFVLSLLAVGENATGECGGRNRPEILFAAKGTARIQQHEDGKTVELKTGQSCFVPANAPPCTISGNAEIYRASVPA